MIYQEDIGSLWVYYTAQTTTAQKVDQGMIILKYKKTNVMKDNNQSLVGI